jgi:hypothetical protein
MNDQIRPQRLYVLRLVKELLALEGLISRGKCRYSTPELCSRLMLMDRLLTAPLRDLGSLGLPTPLPTPGDLIRSSIATMEERRLRWAQTMEHPPERGAME